MKPAGVKVLKQVADVQQNQRQADPDEGHRQRTHQFEATRFQDKLGAPTARATTGALPIDHGGVDRQYLSAVGYADTHPLASNDTEEGRSSNRRIEIVLYPKDLKEIAGEVETSTAASK